MQPPQPPHPPEPGTSLELTFETSVDNVAAPTASTELKMPPSEPAPERISKATEPETAEPAAPGMLGNLVVAQFRQIETAMLGRIVISALAAALPSSIIRLERRRSLGQRLSRRTAEPIGITISSGDQTLSFRAPEDGVAQAEVAHTVRGVVLSSTPVPVAQWLDKLAEVLDQLSSDDEITRAALEQTLLS